MSDLQTSLVINLAGNLPQQTQRYSRSLQQMSQRGQRYMHGLNRAVSAVGNGLDRLGNRYTALLTGAGLTMAAREVMALETRFERLGIQAGKTQDEMAVLKKSIFDVSQEKEIRVDPSQITSAIESIVEKTGDLAFAEANIRNIGLAIQATGADGQSIGEILGEFQKMGMVDPNGIMQTLDVLNVQGKEGAFTLQNLASLGPRVITAYTATGRTGAVAMREMGAALQMIRMGTGSAEMAATAFEATMRTLTDPKKIKMLEKAGIQIFDPKAAESDKKVLRPINELMAEIIQKVNGDATKLGRVFDAEAVRAFNAAASDFQRTGSLSTLQKFMDVQADGTTTMRDSARAAQTSQASLQNLLTAWQQFQDNQLSGPIQDAADALNSLEAGTVQRWLEIGKNIAIAGAAIVGLRKVGQAVGWLNRLRSGASAGRAGGIGGAVAGAAGMGSAQPVFVVNMPGAGMGAGAGAGAGAAAGSGRPRPARSGRAARIGGRLLGDIGLTESVLGGRVAAAGAGSVAMGVGAAAAAGYAVGSVIHDKLIKGTDTEMSIGRGIAKALAFFGNDTAQAALDAEKRAQGMNGQLEISVKDDRVDVKKVRGSNMDMDVSGLTMGMM